MGESHYESSTYWEHLVYEYTGLTFLQIDELDYIDYLQYRLDAFIDKLSRTEKGREYLDNAWRIEQTAPDRQTLRREYGGGG